MNAIHQGKYPDFEMQLFLIGTQKGNIEHVSINTSYWAHRMKASTEKNDDIKGNFTQFVYNHELLFTSQTFDSCFNFNPKIFIL